MQYSVIQLIYAASCPLADSSQIVVLEGGHLNLNGDELVCIVLFFRDYIVSPWQVAIQFFCSKECGGVLVKRDSIRYFQ